MKKAILFLSALFLGAATVKAVPAYPYPVRVTQPDGSVITIRQHGDEFYHWTTSDGYVVEKDKQGFYKRVSLVERRSAPRSQGVLADVRRDRARNYAEYYPAVPGFTKGEGRFLVILVEFSDLQFTVSDPQQAFINLLNQEGYSANGGTGSVRDYYMENSTNQFRPSFDVIGPIQVSGTYASYGEDVKDSAGNRRGDKNASGAFWEACTIAHNNSLVNFSNYDLDKDGVVDNVFFYYAGHNQAENGGDDTIWPHASYLRGHSYDGVSFGRYACTSEYRGASGNTMCGIGTFCHEFGHVLGLPDFYDTDYSENGQANDVMNYSLMANGPYNNNGRTPPYLGAVERQMLGWASGPTLWGSSGTKTLKAVTTNASAYTPTSVDGEFFLYEVRTGEGWDKYISTSYPAAGLVVYHVDQSETVVADGLTAKYIWDHWGDGLNILNAYGSHPCYYIVPSLTSYRDYADIPFGGHSGVTSFTDFTSPASKDWNKVATGYNLTDISYADGQVTLTLTIDKTRKVLGTVTDTAGNPIEGATVTLTDANAVDSAPVSGLRIRSQRQIRSAAQAAIQTDAKGYYEVQVPEAMGEQLILTVSKANFRVYTSEFTLKSGGVRKDVVLKGLAETDKVDLKKYTTPSGYGLGFGANPANACAGAGFSSEELGRYAGMKFSQLSFLLYGDAAEAVDALIEIDGERVFTKRVQNPTFGETIVVDVDEDIIIPEGKDVIIGYAFKNLTDKDSEGNASTPYPLAIDNEAGVVNAGLVRTEYATSAGPWSIAQTQDGTTFNFIVGAVLEDSISAFYAAGFRAINNPKAGAPYSAGSSFRFELMESNAEAPASVVWKFDGVEQSESSVVLTAGEHTVEAILTYADGRIEHITQVIKAE